MADRLNLQKTFFRLNLIITSLVFLILNPTVHVYKSWFPDKKDELWILPVTVVILSAILWFMTSLSIPILIRWGWVKDLRVTPREKEYGMLQTILRTVFPILLTSFNLFLMIFFASSLIAFLRDHPFQSLFVNI